MLPLRPREEMDNDRNGDPTTTNRRQETPMTNPEHRFTTDSNPSEEELERVTQDAAYHFKEVLIHNCPWFLGVQYPLLKEGVRTALEKHGVATPRRVEDAIWAKTLGEEYNERDRTTILGAFQEAIPLTER